MSINKELFQDWLDCTAEKIARSRFKFRLIKDFKLYSRLAYADNNRE